MAYYDLVWYCNAGDQSTTGYYAVAKRPQNTAVVAGQLARQFTAPAVSNERVFVCTVAGTTANTTDATWVLTRGAKTTDGTATWQECTGIAAVNGDTTNTVNWTAAKAIGTPTLGTIIKRNSGASYQICTTAGTMGASEPSFSDTAGVTTNDGTSVWTSLGLVGNFSNGGAPHRYLGAVCVSTWFAAGQTIYVGDNHAETIGVAYGITPAGSQTAVGRIICHNHLGNYPPTAADLATTATISTTAAVALTLTLAGTFYVYGLSFIAGVGQSGNASLALIPQSSFSYFDNCTFKLATTAVGTQISLNGAGAAALVWNACKVSFSAIGQYIDIGNTIFTWQNTGTVLVSGSTVPTNLLGNSVANRLSNVMLEALDLSQVTSVFSTLSTASFGNCFVKDCKLNASVTFPTAPNTGQIVQIIRSDSSATAYKSARYVLEGTETTETSVTRVGGASDPTGQAQSRKIVTTANTQWPRPFKAEPYVVWNNTVAGNVTATVCGTINAGSIPNNDELWAELEYLGTASFPLGNIITSTKANVLTAGGTTGVNGSISSDGSTWNGGGSGAGWSPFKIVFQLDTTHNPQPQFAGYMMVRIRAAKASTTYYIDPQITLS